METFELVLILLAVILVSTLFAQFIPRISLPLVQIGLGIIMAMLAVSPIEFHVDPQLFLILFIAPLLFDESRHVNKRDLWKNKGSILSLAIGLVLLTILVIGFALHWFIPSMPLAAAFALGAALGPTDAVAVSALSKDISISSRQKSLLSGESLINDASGVVSFQFAIAAAVTGTFSITAAGESFTFSFLGGIGVGLAFGALCLFALRLIREHGYESTTVHVVFELFIPFIIFLVAEHLHVSGILAVVAAGLLITLFPQRLTPMLSRLNIISKSVWEVVVFIINGILFVLLGMELPQAFSSEWDSEHINNNVDLVGYVLLVTFLVVAVRFIWIIVMETLRRDSQTGKRGLKITKKLARDALVTTLAGPKGAISLSIAFTIPYTVASGMDFPYRGFLIFVASGTILCTLLLANFIVPLLAPKSKEEASDAKQKIEVDIEILQTVILELKEAQTEETAIATGIVVRQYKDRIHQLRQQGSNLGSLQKMRLETMDFQEEVVRHSMDQGLVDQELGKLFLKRLSARREVLSRNKRAKYLIDTIIFWRKTSQQLMGKGRMSFYNEDLHRLRIDVEKQTIAYLEKRLEGADQQEAKCIVALQAEHKSLTTELQSEASLFRHADPQRALSYIKDIESEGLRFELGQIQQMYEDERLDRATAQSLRGEVYLMQADLNYR